MAHVKKTWLIDPALVQRAKKICGARTETETVTRALKEMVVEDAIDKAFRKYGAGLAGNENRSRYKRPHRLFFEIRRR